jgi:hypothetical protein
MSSNQVNSDNQSKVAMRIYPLKPELVWKFKLGDKVRISRYKHIFQKGYLPNWTEEVFITAERFPTFLVSYGFIDLSGDDINNKFYEPEVLLITKIDDVFIVEIVSKTRRRNGNFRVFRQVGAILISLTPGLQIL